MSFFQDKWPEKDIEKLIRLIRVNSCLWNSRSKDYKNSEARENALLDISRRIGVSKDEVRKKYRTLRTQYIREVRNSKTRGYLSRWTYFDALKFLSEDRDDLPIALWDPMNLDDTEDWIQRIPLPQKEDTHNTHLEDEYAYIEEEFLDIADESSDMVHINADSVDVDNIDSVEFERLESSPVKKKNECFNGVNHKSSAKIRNPTVLLMKAPRKLRDEHTIFGENVANELRLLKNKKHLQNTLKCSILQAIIDVNRAANASFSAL